MSAAIFVCFPLDPLPRPIPGDDPVGLCGSCGGTLHVRSWSHGKSRKYFYACSGYHLRDKTVCVNSADAPMVDTDEILIEALLDDVLDPSIVREAVEEAIRLIAGGPGSEADPVKGIEGAIAKAEQERARIVTAIATGGNLETGYWTGSGRAKHGLRV